MLVNKMVKKRRFVPISFGFIHQKVEFFQSKSKFGNLLT